MAVSCLQDIKKINEKIRAAQTITIRKLHKLVFETDPNDRGSRQRLREFTGFKFERDSKTHLKKLAFIDSEFSEADLIAICTLLCIDYTGEKSVLAHRVCDSLMNLTWLTQKTDEDDDEREEEKEEDDALKTTMKENEALTEQLRQLQAKVAQMSTKNRSSSDESSSESSGASEGLEGDGVEKKKKKKKKTKEEDAGNTDSEDEEGARYAIPDQIQVAQPANAHKFALTFRDVEGSIRTYDGNEKYPVRRWIEDFEETATLMGWDEMQKFVFAKKSLTGLAKLFVQSERGIGTWHKLKKALKKEFQDDTSAAEIHRLLTNRRKTREESLQEYFLVMREIASRSVIDDKSVIQYVIDGIEDDSGAKLILYGARDIKEFKEKLKTYQSACERNPQKQTRSEKTTHKTTPKEENRQKQTTTSKGISEEKRCYNCGQWNNHEAKDCPHKSKGLKCFKCNNFGHKAVNCRELDSKPDPSVKVALNARPKMKEVVIQGQKVEALVDTGCQLNLIREDVYGTLGSPELKSTDVVLTGFGKNYVSPRGYFPADVQIDDDTFSTDFYVVSEDTLKLPAIIGNDVLDQAVVTISKVGIKVTKEKPGAYLYRIDVVAAQELDIGEAPEETVAEIKRMVEEYEPRKEKTTNVEMSVTMKMEQPIYSQPRRLAPAEKEVAEKQIQQWLEEGIIQPSSSEYASPVVVTTKKDGTPRLCIDYRRLNRQVVRDRFPLPLIDDILDKLCDARVFSTLDLRNGFFHVAVKEDSRKYLAFVTRSGQWEFLKVPFGYCNSPAVFQRHINCVFRELIQAGIVMVYMDDVVVPGKDVQDGLMKLKMVMEVAQVYGLDIKFSKCQFLKRKIEFLGHVIEEGTVAPTPRKAAAVQFYPEPKTLAEVHSFLGLSGYFRKFIPNYAKVAKPLSDLLRTTNKEFRFDEEQRIAFVSLKKALSENPVLIIYNPTYETEVHCDASKFGYGAVLLQRLPDDGQLHPVQYLSKKTKPEEERYCSYELEVLAVVMALKRLRVYLLGIKFKIITDCSAFQKTMDKKDLTPRIARWAMTLEEFDYTIEHRAGTRIPHADALSRHPTVLYGLVDGLVARVKRAQQADEGLCAIMEHLQSKPYKDYTLQNGILFKFCDGQDLLVVPRLMQHEVVKNAHEKGHYAALRTEEEVKREFYIPEVKKLIGRVISNCVKCLLVNRKSGKQEGFLHPLFKESTPLHTYHIDHLGPLEPTSKGYKHIFAVIDSFTKFVWLYPTKTTTTREALTKLELQKGVFGNPAQIVSDRGPAFTSHEFADYCKENNIVHALVTTGLPRANGQVERVNSVIVPVLLKKSLENPGNWYQHVEATQRAMNSTYHRSIKKTPFELLTGVKMRCETDLEIVEMINDEMIDEFETRRDNYREEARMQIEKVQQENKKAFDRRRRPARQYEEGDIVAIKRTQLGSGLKLKEKYHGPYRISRVKPNDTYDVRREGNHMGPNRTTTCAEYLKPWADVDSSSEADDQQDSRVWDSSEEPFLGFPPVSAPAEGTSVGG